MSIKANNTALNEILETINGLPNNKEEQTKAIDITENGTTVVTPDEGMTLGEVTVNVEVEGGGTEEIENLIDQSEVLENTEGTALDKVEQLIDKAEWENIWYEHFKNNGFAISSTYGLFKNYTGTILPKIDVSKFQTMAYFCAGATNLERIDFYLNSELATTFFNAFRNANALKYIKGVNTSKSTSVTSMFYRNLVLEEIAEPLDFSSVITAGSNTDCFSGTDSLVEVRFVAESIKVSINIPSAVLSNESIKSILRGLAYVETMQTLKLNIDVYNRLIFTEDDEMYELYDNAVVEKGWDIAY